MNVLHHMFLSVVWLYVRIWDPSHLYVPFAVEKRASIAGHVGILALFGKTNPLHLNTSEHSDHNSDRSLSLSLLTAAALLNLVFDRHLRGSEQRQDKFRNTPLHHQGRSDTAIPSSRTKAPALIPC